MLITNDDTGSRMSQESVLRQTDNNSPPSLTEKLHFLDSMSQARHILDYMAFPNYLKQWDLSSVDESRISQILN